MQFDYNVYKKNHPDRPLEVVRVCLTLDSSEYKRTNQNKNHPCLLRRNETGS
jgi:hypothetical protein